MINVRSHYEVLGISPTATTPEIKQRYRELAKQFHPDHARDKDTAHQIFAEVSQSYRVLIDPELRQAYDTTLRGPAPAAKSVQPRPSAQQDAQPKNSLHREAAPYNGPERREVARRDISMHRAVSTAMAYSESEIEQMLEEAQSSLKRGKAGRAVALCSEVVLNDPDNFLAYSIMGDAQAQMRQPRKAAAAYKHALRISPSTAVKTKLARLDPANGLERGSPEPQAARIGAGFFAKSPFDMADEPKGGSLFSRLFRR